MSSNKHIKSYEQINEERSKPFNTGYSGMVTSAISSLYSSVMAIAQQIANEKLADKTPGATGEIQEIDITKAMNLMFHSDWKKNMKQQCIAQVQLNAAERARKQDELSDKKNQKAVANMSDDNFNVDIDKSTVRFSDERGSGQGSNQ